MESRLFLIAGVVTGRLSIYSVTTLVLFGRVLV
jgi:hypothetical protein